MRVTLSCLADAANVSTSGKLNILGEFNHLSAPKVPVMWPLMTYVARLEMENSDQEQILVELRVVDDDEVPVISPMPFVWTRGERAPAGEVIVSPILLEIHGATFATHGTYSFVLTTGGKEIARTYLYVTNKPLGD